MAHVFIGLVLGLILNRIFHDKNIVIFCIIGSILPDLVKILFGHSFTGSLLKSARFYSQTLALFLLFLVAGVFIWKYYRSNSFLCVSVGIFFHGIADMWKNPDWHFSLFEPYIAALYQGHSHEIIFREIHFIILQEFTSVTEWIFFIATISITSFMIMKKPVKDPGKEP